MAFNQNLHLLVTSILTIGTGIGCGYTNPVAPTPIAVIPAAPTQTQATELRVHYAPLDVYSGGATQVYVGVFGYDPDGTLRSVPGLPVAFNTDLGKLTVLLPVTGYDGFAVALLEPDKSDQRQTIHVLVQAGNLTTTVTVNVWQNGVYPSPAPPAPPAPTPTLPKPPTVPAPTVPPPAPTGRG